MSIGLFFISICCFLAVVTSEDEVRQQPKCTLYLAPSFTRGIGRGVFAGASFREGDQIDNSMTLAIHHNAIFSWQLNNYVWETDEIGTSMAEFGLGMLFNHRNPATVSHTWPTYIKKASEQELAHTTYSTVLNTAMRDIVAGEELFVSYCSDNQWFEQRGIVVDNKHMLDTYVPPTRSSEELEELGICLNNIKVQLANCCLPLRVKRSLIRCIHVKI